MVASRGSGRAGGRRSSPRWACSPPRSSAPVRRRERAWPGAACAGPPVVRPASVGTWFRLDPVARWVGQPGRRSAWSSGPARRSADGLALDRRSRSPPVRSMAPSWSARTTGRAPAVAARCRAALRMVARPRSATSSVARRSTRPGHDVYRDPGGPDDPSRPRGLAPLPAATARPSASWSRSRPTAGSAARGRPSSSGRRTGRGLAVQSCGEAACRIRLVEPDGGPVPMIADPSLGELVGLGLGSVVVRGACRGRPCPVVAVRIRDRATTVLDPAADGGRHGARIDGRPAWSWPPIDRPASPRDAPTVAG